MRQESFRKTVLAAALLSLCAALPVAACAAGTADNASASKSATGMTSDANAKTAVSSSDKKFVEKASGGGIAEVQLGKLAEQKAQNAEVRKFGERMVKDHGSAGEKLSQVATKKGISPASDMDASSKREYDKLSKLSGAQFDREYMSHMVSDHKKDVADFKKEANGAKDADVRQFASATLPTLQEHLQLAQAADKAAKSEGKTRTSSRANGKTGS